MVVKKRENPDLFVAFKGTTTAEKKAPVDLTEFRDSVLTLFSGIINEESVDSETKGKLARLRARIEIELKEV